MCGRTCLTLSLPELVNACTYKTSTTVDKKPEFRQEFNCGKKYVPSYNIAPTDVTPVLVSALHFDDESKITDRILIPMMWGLIPCWHKGDYRKNGLTTNNCRLESMLQSTLYKPLFLRGQRCVILCEGFYEWQTTKMVKSSERDAYYFYMPQTDGIHIANKETWPSPDNIRLLCMAGLFDVWTDANGDNMFSYTVITFESDQTFSWLHHRSPAILENEQDIFDWLDFKRVPAKDALILLKPASQLIWHRVSNIVNNSRNKLNNCNKPIEQVKEEKCTKLQNTMLHTWLSSSSQKAKSFEVGEDDTN